MNRSAERVTRLPLVKRSRGSRSYWIRRLRSSNRGTAMVELALVITMLMMLFSGVFEFGRFYYSRITLQHAVREAARFAVTGNVLNDAQGNPMSRVASIQQVIQTKAYNLNVAVNNITVVPPDGGGPGDIVTITTVFRYDFVVPPVKQFFPPGHVDFTISTAMKNEPFFP